MANIQAYREIINNRRYLVLRGLNPTNKFLKEVSAGNFVETVFDFAHKLAKSLGFTGEVYLTESLNEIKWSADSNRTEVRKYLLEKIYNDPMHKPRTHTMWITTDQEINKVYPVY